MTVNYNGTIKSLRDIVWGVVTDPLSQIEQITLLIFIKLLSERHNELERLKAKKLIFIGEYASYHFDSLSRLSGYELVDTTRKAVESLYKNPNIDEPIRRLYERSYLQVNDPRVLSLLINEINKIDIEHIDMGDFYEHLLSVLGTQKEAGQFRTPRHLIEFIVDVVDPQIGERVLDPACGTAGFLTAAYTHIRDANTSQEAKKSDSYLDKLNFDQKTFLLNKTIFGFDIDPKMIKFAISNLYLHNIKNPNISQHNTLTSNDSWEEKYDVILTNPPFSTPKGGVKPTDRYTLDSKRTEVLFAEYVIEHLTFNGRAGVIVPEGIIFQSGKAYKELRKWLVENNYLYAVVSLPSGVFNPYSGVKTSILFLDRQLAKRSDSILFVKIDNDGYDLGAQRREIRGSELPLALTIINSYKRNIADQNLPQTDKLETLTKNTISIFVPKSKIRNLGDYYLTGEKYKEINVRSNQKWPMVELKEICSLQRGLSYSSKELGDKNQGLPLYNLKSIKKDGNLHQYDFKYYKGEIKNKHYVKRNDILIALTDLTPTSEIIGSPKIIIDSTKACYSADLAKVIINDSQSINSYFLYQLLRSKKYRSHIINYSHGANVKHLQTEGFYSYKIPLPPLSIQQQIVDEIEDYQKIIDGAKQVINNYKPQIKIDPEWKKVKLKDLCKLSGGGTPSKAKSIYWTNGNIKWISAKHISEDGKITGCEFITNKAVKESSTVVIPKNSIIFVTRVSVGKVTLSNNDYAINQDLTGIEPIKQNLSNIKYLYFILRLFSRSINKLAQGLGVRGITRKDFGNTEIPLPSLEIQTQLVFQIEQEQEIVEANKKLIQLFEQKIKDKIAEVWGEKNGE